MSTVEKENFAPLGELSKNKKISENVKIEEQLKKVSLDDDRSVEVQAAKIPFDPELEPLLAENPERFVIFPINYQGKQTCNIVYAMVCLSRLKTCQQTV